MSPHRAFHFYFLPLLKGEPMPPTAYSRGYLAGKLGLNPHIVDPSMSRLDKIAWTHGYHNGSGKTLLKGATA